MSRVILVVSGGIAAYKAADIASGLTKAGCTVDVIMTENATKFITPLTFEALTHRKVYTDTFDYQGDGFIAHVGLAQEADLMLVAPATANIMAKMAHGIADDMATSTFLATTAAVVVCPAMNTHMYETPATQDNLATLRSRGIITVGPAVGKLACGDVAQGVLAPVDQIVQEALRLLEG